MSDQINRPTQESEVAVELENQPDKIDSNKIDIGIIGGAGYTAGELIRLLSAHPNVDSLFVQSQSHAGQHLSKAHPDLIGELSGSFVQKLPDTCRIVFLCSGHGKTKEVFDQGWIPTQAKVIDLSADARWELTQGKHSERHHCCGKEFVYGLAELQANMIRNAHFVANPGCFATAIQLALLPLAKQGKLHDEVHVSAITGSTGAGAHPSSTTHFSWRSNNASIYKAFTHQHLGEIRASVSSLQPKVPNIHFIPMRGAFTRGILAACYQKIDASEQEIKEWFMAYYSDAPFVHLSEEPISVKQVVNTNKALIHLEKVENQVLVTVAIDNLLKGASGQAVQNMNIMMGWDERMGLLLKPSVF